MRKADEGHMGTATALVRSAFLVNAVYADSGREHGITAQQGQLLCVLMVKPYGMRELGTVLGLAKSSLTGLVDRCVQRGLVRREPDPEDGRAVRVATTEAGSELADAFYAETCRRVEALAVGLDEPDRELLTALLGRLVLENKVPMVFRESCENAPAATPGC